MGNEAYSLIYFYFQTVIFKDIRFASFAFFSPVFYYLLYFNVCISIYFIYLIIFNIYIYIIYICIWYMFYPFFPSFSRFNLLFYLHIFFLFLERRCREWSGGAGAWRPEGVRDLSAVTVLHDHKQRLVGQLVRHGRAVPSGPASSG